MMSVTRVPSAVNATGYKTLSPDVNGKTFAEFTLTLEPAADGAVLVGEPDVSGVAS